jgi:hypothetical protein
MGFAKGWTSSLWKTSKREGLASIKGGLFIGYRLVLPPLSFIVPSREF